MGTSNQPEPRPEVPCRRPGARGTSADRTPRSRWWWGVWLLPLTLQVALLWLAHEPTPRVHFGDEGAYLEAARSVLESGTSDLGSFWPPAYAWFLAPLVAAGGGSLWSVQVMQVALLALAAGLFGYLVETALADRLAGRLGLFTMLSFPPLVAFSHYLWPEVLHLTLMLAAAAILTRYGPRPWAAALAGVVLALCLQTKVLLLPLVPLLIAVLWLAWPREARVGALLALLGAMALGTLPTLLAQQRDFGRPMLADSGWFNLWVGLNEASREEFVDSVVVEEYPRYRQSARSSQARARVARDKVAQLLAERGLWRTLRRQAGRQFHRLLGKDSFLTQQLGGGAIFDRGDGYAAGASPLGRAVRWLAYGFWAVVLVGAALGIALFPYRGRPVGLWILGFLLLQCAMFLFLHVKSRYRIQMLPGFFFFAIYAVLWWRDRGFRASPTVGPRLLGGGALAVLLLWLAFSAA